MWAASFPGPVPDGFNTTAQARSTRVPVAVIGPSSLAVSESTRSESHCSSGDTRISARLPAVIATGATALLRNPARSAPMAEFTSAAEQVPSMRSASAAQTRVACRRNCPV